mmetsp:Transcript_121149/g.354028  ORF Transcript_121149/g.354028 Transcript_121149/m.354028 type:complete len:212 (-) Transcript_121149:508-1143(-)
MAASAVSCSPPRRKRASATLARASRNWKRARPCAGRAAISFNVGLFLSSTLAATKIVSARGGGKLLQYTGPLKDSVSDASSACSMTRLWRALRKFGCFLFSMAEVLLLMSADWRPGCWGLPPAGCASSGSPCCAGAPRSSAKPRCVRPALQRTPENALKQRPWNAAMTALYWLRMVPRLWPGSCASRYLGSFEASRSRSKHSAKSSSDSRR